MRAAVVAVLVACAAGAAALLGGRAPAQAASLPACVHPAHPVARPAGLGRFPLPRGAVLDGVRQAYGYRIVSGFVPGAINPVRDFLVARLPDAGYHLGRGDAETAEAEAAYRGHGVRGRWKVRAVPGCPGALSIQIAVR